MAIDETLRAVTRMARARRRLERATLHRRALSALAHPPMAAAVGGGGGLRGGLPSWLHLPSLGLPHSASLDSLGAGGGLSPRPGGSAGELGQLVAVCARARACVRAHACACVGRGGGLCGAGRRGWARPPWPQPLPASPQSAWPASPQLPSLPLPLPLPPQASHLQQRLAAAAAVRPASPRRRWPAAAAEPPRQQQQQPQPASRGPSRLAASPEGSAAQSREGSMHGSQGLASTALGVTPAVAEECGAEERAAAEAEAEAAAAAAAAGGGGGEPAAEAPPTPEEAERGAAAELAAAGIEATAVALGELGQELGQAPRLEAGAAAWVDVAELALGLDVAAY